MSRVHVKIDNIAPWYDQLSSISNYYEIDIENRILEHASTTFKGYHVSKFKKVIKDKNTGNTAAPDLVFIREDYADWFIVEVELYKHGKLHPEKQIDVFIDGVYTSKDLVTYIKDKLPVIDETKLTYLIDSIQPKVLVIVDSQYASWIDSFKKKKCLICIFEVYKNTNGVELFRLKGDYPHIIASICHVITHSPGFTYEITDASLLAAIPNATVIDVYYNNLLMKAKVIKNSNKLYLSIVNSLVPQKKDVVFFVDGEGKFHFKLN